MQLKEPQLEFKPFVINVLSRIWTVLTWCSHSSRLDGATNEQKEHLNINKKAVAGFGYLLFVNTLLYYV